MCKDTYRANDAIKTSTKQVPAVIKKYADHLRDRVWLNYGCGKYPFLAESIAGGWHYDPYLPKGVRNVIDFKFCDNVSQLPCNFETVVVANVLNVLTDSILEHVLQELSTFFAPDTYIFSIYEGDRTGAHKVTKIGTYQRNERTADYISKIECALVGYKVTKKGNEIHATKV